ncbi:MAG: inovirus-type Gp2 protein [Cycloclasticus sp.]
MNNTINHEQVTKTSHIHQPNKPNSSDMQGNMNSNNNENTAVTTINHQVKNKVTSINKQTKRRSKKEKDITYSTAVNFDGVLLPIQNREDWGSYRSALNTLHSQFKNMLSHHCKVLVLRMDFHVNLENWNEGDLSLFLKRSKRVIGSYYKLKRIGHAWGREVSQNGSHHYHLVLMLDGNKVNRPMVVTNILTQEWKKLGHPHPRRNNCHLLSNTVDDKFKGTFHHCSYIAKVHTKDQQPNKARNFGASQIKPAERIKQPAKFTG